MSITGAIRKSQRHISSSQPLNTNSEPNEAFIQSPTLPTMASLQEITKIAEFKEVKQDLEDFEKASLDEKMNKLMRGMQSVLQVHQELSNNIARHEYHILHATDGINPRLNNLQQQVDSNTETLNNLQLASKKELKEAIKEIKSAKEDLNSFASKEELDTHQSEVKNQIEDLISAVPEASDLQTVKQDLQRAIGIIAKQEKQINSMADRIADLTARSMETNFTITGLMEPFQLAKTTPKDAGPESCAETIMTFMRTKLNIDILQEDVLQAYRVGRSPPQGITARPRLLFFQCTAKWAIRIKQQANLLKNVTNDNGQQITIAQQLPDSLIASKGKINEILKPIKEANKTKPVKEKTKFSIHQHKLYIEGEQIQEKVLVPTVQDLFPSVEKQQRINEIEMKQTAPDPFMGSVFTGYATQIADIQDAKDAYIKVKQLNPQADHVIMAFTVGGDSGAQDDGEHRAARKILKKLTDQDERNVAVFVTRVYGGRPMGPARFEYILKTAQKALDELNN